MSEENNTPQSNEGNVEDPSKNMKAEFDRKIGNLSDVVKQQSEQLNEALSLLAQQNAPKEEPVESDDDLLYSNPAEFKKRVAEQAKQEAIAAQQQMAQAQAAEQQVLVKMVSDYPELNNISSPLAIKAQEKSQQYNNLPGDVAIKLAIQEAASELGLLPQSKRAQYSGDDFVAGGSRAPAPTADDKKKKEIPQEIADIAMLLGRNLDDEATKERLKKAMNRNFYKYE